MREHITNLREQMAQLEQGRPIDVDGWPWLMTRIIRPYEKSVSISDLGG